MSIASLQSDADLVAFVDGRLSADKTRAIATAAKSDVALSARIGELAAGSPDMGALWGDMLASAPSGMMTDLPVAPLPQVSRRAWLSGIGGLALGFVAGFGALRSWTPIQGDWETAVADYHMLYGAATVRGLDPSDQARAAELAAVEVATGLKLPSLAIDGLTYRRAQMLDLRGRAIVHIVLTTADVVPIAFCLTADTGPIRQPSFRQVADMGLVTWANGTSAACLVARLSASDLLKLADALAA